MAGIQSGERAHHRGRPTARSVLGWIVALAPLLLAAAAVIGLGLLRGVPGALALLCGLALAILPWLGLAVLIGGRRPGAALAAWLWTLLLLVSLPLYFPGERVTATEAGLRWLGALTGEGASAALGRGGAGLVAMLGPDPRPVPPRSAQREAMPAARPAARAPGEAAAAVQSKEPEARDSVVRLPYEGDERSLLIRADVDGPHVGEQLSFIFDTGATFTTLDRASLEALDIVLPPDAPRVTLRTANGEIEAPLVLLDAVWLGGEPVEWVTAAVCDSCANPPAVGLLGLNVSQQFRVFLDHDHKQIELRRRTRGDDRQLDVGQWLDIRSSARRYWNGRVEVELTARNRAAQEIRSAVVELHCGADAFAVQLDDIPPGGERSTEISLPRGTDCSAQTISLARAHWLLDRF